MSRSPPPESLSLVAAGNVLMLIIMMIHTRQWSSSKAGTGTVGGIDLVGASTGKVVVLGRQQNHSEIT